MMESILSGEPWEARQAEWRRLGWCDGEPMPPWAVGSLPWINSLPVMRLTLAEFMALPEDKESPALDHYAGETWRCVYRPSGPKRVWVIGAAAIGDDLSVSTRWYRPIISLRAEVQE